MFLRSDGGPARTRGIEARKRGSLVVADGLLKFIDILSLSGSLSCLSSFRRLSGSRLSLPSHSNTFRVSGSGICLHNLQSLSSGQSSLLWIRVYTQFHCLGCFLCQCLACFQFQCMGRCLHRRFLPLGVSLRRFPVGRVLF